MRFIKWVFDCYSCFPINLAISALVDSYDSTFVELIVPFKLQSIVFHKAKQYFIIIYSFIGSHFLTFIFEVIVNIKLFNFIELHSFEFEMRSIWFSASCIKNSIHLLRFYEVVYQHQYHCIRAENCFAY